MSMAIVIFPTPPGTGVINEATPPHLIEGYVADEASATLFRRVRYPIHADVDDDRAGFDHVAGDHLRPTGRDDQDVRSPRVRREIARLAVARR